MYSFLFGAGQNAKSKGSSFSVQPGPSKDHLITKVNGKPGGFVKGPTGWIGIGANSGEQFIRSGIFGGWKKL